MKSKKISHGVSNKIPAHAHNYKMGEVSCNEWHQHLLCYHLSQLRFTEPMEDEDMYYKLIMQAVANLMHLSQLCLNHVLKPHAQYNIAVRRSKRWELKLCFRLDVFSQYNIRDSKKMRGIERYDFTNHLPRFLVGFH